jgi:hypothetical protein
MLIPICGQSPRPLLTLIIPKHRWKSITWLKAERIIMAQKTKTEIERTEIAVIEVTEGYLREKMYEFRGRKVMLDLDLTKIYGYETKNFNRQVDQTGNEKGSR